MTARLRLLLPTLVRSPLRVLRRIPFTLALVALVVAVALTTSGPGLTARPALVARWGFALHDLWDGTFWSLVTAVFFLHRPDLVWGTALFALASAGVYEWCAGTRRAFAVYWTGDVTSTLLLALAVVLPLTLAGTSLGARLALADDVGISGGGFTCLGAWMGHLPPRPRLGAFAAVGVYLVWGLTRPDGLEASILHVIALPLGVALDRWVRRPARTMG